MKTIKQQDEEIIIPLSITDYIYLVLAFLLVGYIVVIIISNFFGDPKTMFALVGQYTMLFGGVYALYRWSRKSN